MSTRRGHDIKRLLALAAAIALVLCVLSSVLFISLSASHACAGEDCLICGVMERCSSALKLCAAFALCALCALRLVLRAAEGGFSPVKPFFTPVLLKVRINA